jgi:hypothetical protein
MLLKSLDHNDGPREMALSLIAPFDLDAISGVFVMLFVGDCPFE